MRRTFAIDVETCDRCGARMRLRATRFVIPDGGLVTAAASIQRYLRHVGESPDPPPLSPARGPPFFKSRVLRRKFGELDGRAGSQTEMPFS
jgi:hypothetical protein